MESLTFKGPSYFIEKDSPEDIVEILEDSYE